MVGIIGGSGFYNLDWLEKTVEKITENEYGLALLKVGILEGKKVVFMARHGFSHSIPPLAINFRANLKAFADEGVTDILSTSAVGGIINTMKPGDFAITTQFIDMTWGRCGTFYDKPGKVVHTDVSNPYSPKLRNYVCDSLKTLGLPFHDHAVYICTQGPRFETPAEIKAYAIMGATIVGMTGCPEVALAAELGIPYASIAVITNLAAGVSINPLSHTEVINIFNDRISILSDVLRLTTLKVLENPSTPNPPRAISV